MILAAVNAIVRQQGAAGIPYPYFRDKFALMRAAWEAGDGLSVRDAKRSPIAGLLQRPLLQAHCARSGHISADAMRQLISAQPTEWTLRRNLGVYGIADDHFSAQTSRPGFNLVLRLDFDRTQVQQALRLGLHRTVARLENWNHMKADEGYNLSWTRIDMDWDTGEALIEELQNDWLRRAKALIGEQTAWKHAEHQRRQEWKRTTGLQRYHAEQLAPLENAWAEMTLCATLEFLRDGLGLHTVYMHSAQSGAIVKEIYGQPPRYLYDDIPRKFCFTMADKPPVFLARAWTQDMRGDDKRHLRKMGQFKFWKMAL